MRHVPPAGCPILAQQGWDGAISASGIHWCVHAIGSRSDSKSRLFSLHHVQLLSQAAATGAHRRVLYLRKRTGKGSAAIWICSRWLCADAGTCASARRRASDLISRDCAAGAEAENFKDAEATGRCAVLAETILRLQLRNPEKTTEKLRYMHRNPVKRGLVARPEDWPWSSFRHYATGVEGTVEIESMWTARKRELRSFVVSHP